MNLSDAQSKIIRNWPTVLFVIVVVAAWAALALIRPPLSQIPDNRQILYWYAAQLRSGNGLVFNPDERILLIASPAYMLLLAGSGSLLALSDVAQSAEWLFLIAVGVGAVSLYRIARR